VIGRITADILSARGNAGVNAAGEQPMGDVIADAMYEATQGADFGGAVAALHERRRRPVSLLFNQISGGEQPGEVTYARPSPCSRSATRWSSRPAPAAAVRRPRAAVRQSAPASSASWPSRR
jgi:hypothetical protein